MTHVYEATMNDLIHAFMQISNFILWLKGGPTGEGNDSASLEIEGSYHVWRSKSLVDAMKSYPRAKDLNPRGCALKGSELFGFTKHKLNLPSRVHCDSY